MIVNRRKTQRTSTAPTYKKVADFIQNDSENWFARVLDYGAGLCHGTEILRQKPAILAFSFEPDPPEGVTPDWTHVDRLEGKSFDYVVSNCVLNTIEEPDERIDVIQDMALLLKKGGKAIIMVRSWGTVKSAKTKKPYTDGYINDSGTFQRGFTTDELRALILESLYGITYPNQYEIRPTSLGDTGLILERVK
jgi:SAM-dependent methyltransferase